MDTEVTEYASSLRKDSSQNERSPSIDTRPPPKREKHNDPRLARSPTGISFPTGIQIRLPEADETIVSTRPSEVAFYKAAFQVGLCLPIHPMLRRILAHYNVCQAQLTPNAWRSMVGALVLWRFKKFALSLNEFRHLFDRFNNPRPNSGGLYFKARPRHTLIGGYG